MSGIEVKYLPENAGVQVLTIDGGGVCRLMTIQYLKALQERIGLLYPIQENFDLVFRTSSGRQACPWNLYLLTGGRRNHCPGTVY